jgi:paraquat-inducible protein A
MLVSLWNNGDGRTRFGKRFTHDFPSVLALRKPNNPLGLAVMPAHFIPHLDNLALETPGSPARIPPDNFLAAHSFACKIQTGVNPILSDNRRYWPRIFALVYLFIAGIAAWQTIEHTSAATRYFDQICNKASVQNEGAQFVARFNMQHPIIGPFVSPSIKQSLDLPSLRESSHELGTEIPRLAQLVRREAAIAAWWSWLLLSISLIYIVAGVTVYSSFRTRNVLFALTSVSTIFFVVGITAPAMVIYTIPSIPIESGKLAFVLQHEVRSIFSVIAGLFSSGRWIIGGLIVLFSIITPFTKTSLTLISITTKFPSINSKITKFLHSIGKWSMADVFIAAVFLACFALTNQQATRAIPVRGLYYFAGYCLLSMVTTLLLANLNFADENKPPKLGRPFGIAVIGGLFGVVLFFIVVAGIYTFEKHPVPAAPIELDNSRVDLQAHHWQKIPLTVPNSGTLTIELRVTSGNSLDVYLIPADQLSSVEQANGIILPKDLLRASLRAFRAVQARVYNHTGRIDKGEFLIVLQDTTLGILSAPSSGVEVRAYLAP